LCAQLAGHAAFGGMRQGGGLVACLKLLACTLLGLGLLWNATQSGAQVSWAWDWIELAPICLLGSAVMLSHR